MLGCLLKYMPYYRVEVTMMTDCHFHTVCMLAHKWHLNSLQRGRQIFPHNYVTEDSTKQTTEGTQATGGAVQSGGLKVCSHGRWSGLQLSLGPWANLSRCRKPLPIPMTLMHMVCQVFLCWVLQASHPQTLYNCELSRGLQGSSKQVPQVQDGAHWAALSDLKLLIGREGHETCMATVLPHSPHLSSSALLPLLSGGCEVPGGAAPQLPLPSKTDWTMATGSTGGSEQARQPGRGTSGSAVAFTPGLTGSSLISMRHFSLYWRKELAPHTHLLHKVPVLLGRAIAHGFASTSKLPHRLFPFP